MLKQRGFGTLVLLGIVAVFVIGAIGTAAVMIRSNGKDAGIKQATEEWKPKAEKAEIRAREIDADLTQQIALNKHAQAQIAELRSMFKETQDTLASIKVEQEVQEAKTRKAIAAFADREKRQGAEIRRLRDIVAGPVLTEGVLDEADAILRSLVRDRAASVVR